MGKQERKPYIRPVTRILGWQDVKSWATALFSSEKEPAPTQGEDDGRDWVSYLERDSINLPWWEIYSASNGLDATGRNIRAFYMWLEQLEENQEKPELL